MAGEKIDAAVGDRGVLTTTHPSVCLPVQLADKTKLYRAGTVLKASSSVGTFEPAAEDDTPSCVLVEDADGSTGIVRAVFHGVVVKARLLDASGAAAKTASDALVAKLAAAGIFAAQHFDGDVR